MIHLDTHVVMWLARGDLRLVPAPARRQLESEPLAVSPMVELELNVLWELGRLEATGSTVLDELRASIGLQLDQSPFPTVASRAGTSAFAFTREPFDRLIAAQAAVAGARLLTKDRLLRKHLPFAFWS